MKKYYFLIILALILGLALTGCLLSNVGQVPTSEQSGIAYLTKSPGSLVGLWHFDDGSGTTANDSSGNGNTGTLTNMDTPTCWVLGKFGSALSFDGYDDGIYVADSSSLDFSTAITIEAWIYLHSYTNAHGHSIQTVVEKNLAYYLNIQSGKLSFYWYGLSAPGYHKSPSTLPLNTWTHVAATYNGSYVKLYENGVEVYSASVTGTGQTSNWHLGIGYEPYNPATYPRYFDGLIDEVRIWDVALSKDELGKVYDFGGFLPPVSLGKPFKLGSTIPVKFQLMDAQGAFITDASPSISLELIIDGPLTGDVIPGDSSGAANTDDIFRYDPDSNQYIFNLATKDLTAPATYRITVDLGDGTTREVDIGLK